MESGNHASSCWRGNLEPPNQRLEPTKPTAWMTGALRSAGGAWRAETSSSAGFAAHLQVVGQSRRTSSSGARQIVTRMKTPVRCCAADCDSNNPRPFGG